MDWSHLTWDQFIAQNSGYYHRVRAWNHTFSLDYFSFRAELKRISQDNWKNILHSSIVTDTSYLLEDDMLIPSDDDDWFSPNVIDDVVSVNSELVYWNQARIKGNDLIFQHTSIEDMRKIGTNNYAISKRLSNYGFLECHWEAAELFCKMPHIKISKPLSVWVRTPASWSNPDWNDGHQLRKSMGSFAENWTDFPLLPWMKPYLENLVSLVKECLKSKVAIFFL